LKKIDTHCHIHCKRYIEELKRRGWALREVSIIEKAGVMDWQEYVEARIASMDKLDIERQVLSPASPLCYFEDDEFNLYWCQAANDLLAEVCRKYPDRFSGFVTVPLRNVKHAIDELKRVIDAPGMVGVVLGSHLGGKMLDSPELMPFYEELNKMGLTILIHPAPPVDIDKVPAYQRLYNLHQFIGFLFDTTMAVARMVLKGIFEKYENINLITSHLGGTLPYVYHSIDMMWESLVEDHIEVSPKPPSEYFKRFYADTGRPLKAATLQCAIALLGERHILFGSDIPYWMDFNAPERIISAIEGIDLPVQTEEKIFYENAKRLLRC